MIFIELLKKSEWDYPFQQVMKFNTHSFFKDKNRQFKQTVL